MNPLLSIQTPIPFDQIRPEHAEPAMDHLLAEAQRRIDAIAADFSPRSYDNTMAALDAATRTLSHRYAMDFRRAAERYAGLGTPEQVAARIREFHAAGARHVVLDIVGPYERRTEQIRWFARDVLPRLADLR